MYVSVRGHLSEVIGRFLQHKYYACFWYTCMHICQRSSTIYSFCSNPMLVYCLRPTASASGQQKSYAWFLWTCVDSTSGHYHSLVSTGISSVSDHQSLRLAQILCLLLIYMHEHLPVVINNIFLQQESFGRFLTMCIAIFLWSSIAWFQHTYVDNCQWSSTRSSFSRNLMLV